MAAEVAGDDAGSTASAEGVQDRAGCRVGVVARRLGRNFIGLDLSFDYLRDQARARLALDVLDAWNRGDSSPVVDAPKPAGALL